jgi:hypothetical protein
MHYIYQETTQWNDSMGANHVYVFTERPAGRTATITAYVPAGKTQVVRLRTPLKLDLKGRNFVKLA